MSRDGTEQPSVHAHRQSAPQRIPSAVITVSDSRTPETDSGGALVAETLEAAGHPVTLREIVPDDPAEIGAALQRAFDQDAIRCIVFTGGTGIAARDVAPETVEPFLDRLLPGFGELFRALSYEEIGTAAMLSRALAGVAGSRVVFVLPGSQGALRLALAKLILPELGHLVGEAGKGR